MQESHKDNERDNNPVEQSEDIQHRENRIKFLEDSRKNTEVTKHDASDNLVSCFVKSKYEMKQHVKRNHPKTVKCKLCDVTFEENHLLEYHLQNVHKEGKTFKCNECELAFVLNWRLDKHVKIHSSKRVTKTCHFFNNGKICPFQDIVPS